MRREIYSLRAQEPLWIAVGRTGDGVIVKMLTSLHCWPIYLAARESALESGRSLGGVR